MPQSPSIFDPASPEATAVRSLSFLVLAIAVFIFVLVEGVLVYVVIRFRRGVDARTMEPAQFYGSQPIEIAWTAAPAIIVLILVLVTIRTLWEVNAMPPKHHTGRNTLFVTIIGHQWWWEYRYETYNGANWVLLRQMSCMCHSAQRTNHGLFC